MKKYVMALDSGSTGIRAIIFDKEGKLIAKKYEETPPITPKQGWIEHDPIQLWEQTKSVIKEALSAAKTNADEIAAIGITNQRGSFTLWERDTGKPICNLINWADIRASETADAANKSKKWKRLQSMAKLVYFLTRSASMLQASIIKFNPDMASIRLKWYFDNNPDIRERAKKGEICFGTIDSWLIYNLTGGSKGGKHVTDCSNASVTGLYDSFKTEWHKIVLPMFDIPMMALPEVRDTSCVFGQTDPELFGAQIPIGSAVGDQMAAMFGQCCFNKGDVKISHGSGSFVDINTGSKARVSGKGLYSLIAWRLNGKCTYMLEGTNAMTGTMIDWAINHFHAADTPQQLDQRAASVSDSEGVYIVPALSGIRFPYFDSFARGIAIGLSLQTRNPHFCRAILEGIGFRSKDVIDIVESELKIHINDIDVDGGVSNSDPLLQFSADILNKKIFRPEQKEMTALGAAYLAGLSVGFWNDLDELKQLHKADRVFEPNMDEETRVKKYKRWQDAVKKTFNWARPE